VKKGPKGPFFILGEWKWITTSKQITASASVAGTRSIAKKNWMIEGGSINQEKIPVYARVAGRGESMRDLFSAASA